MASNPGQIPAGGKDKISVVVHTNQKGGHKLSKSFAVFTNDPEAPRTQLIVTGEIEALIEVSPDRVSITGYKGDDLSKEVRLTPNKDHLFTIKDVRAHRENKDIAWSLKPLGKEPSKEGYLLTVSCTKEAEGRAYNLLTVRTDLNQKPIIRIPVSCKVFGKRTEDANPTQGAAPDKIDKKEGNANIAQKPVKIEPKQAGSEKDPAKAEQKQE